jgi:hypothetical protein
VRKVIPRTKRTGKPRKPLLALARLLEKVLECIRYFIARGTLTIAGSGPLPLPIDADNVCLNLAVYRSASKALGDRFRHKVGCFAEPRRIARLDLAS